eukprot:2886219-Amphidinium_carterae.3
MKQVTSSLQPYSSALQQPSHVTPPPNSLRATYFEHPAPCSKCVCVLHQEFSRKYSNGAHSALSLKNLGLAQQRLVAKNRPKHIIELWFLAKQLYATSVQAQTVCSIPHQAQRMHDP